MQRCDTSAIAANGEKDGKGLTISNSTMLCTKHLPPLRLISRPVRSAISWALPVSEAYRTRMREGRSSSSDEEYEGGILSCRMAWAKG